MLKNRKEGREEGKGADPLLGKGRWEEGRQEALDGEREKEDGGG